MVPAHYRHSPEVLERKVRPLFSQRIERARVATWLLSSPMQGDHTPCNIAEAARLIARMIYEEADVEVLPDVPEETMTDADDKDIGNELRCILEAYPQLELRIEQKHARYQVSVGEWRTTDNGRIDFNQLQCGRSHSTTTWISYAEADRSELADAIIDLRVKLATEAEKKAAAATAHLRALRGER